MSGSLREGGAWQKKAQAYDRKKRFGTIASVAVAAAKWKKLLPDLLYVSLLLPSGAEVGITIRRNATIMQLRGQVSQASEFKGDRLLIYGEASEKPLSNDSVLGDLCTPATRDLQLFALVNASLIDLFDADIQPSIRRMCCVMRYRSQTQRGQEGVRAFHQLLPGHRTELLEITDSECEKWCRSALAECGDDIDAVGRFATELSATLMDIAAWHIMAGGSMMLTRGPMNGLHLSVLHLVVDQSMSRATGGKELLRAEFTRDNGNIVNGMSLVYCGNADEAMDDVLSKYFDPRLKNAMKSNRILTITDGATPLYWASRNGRPEVVSQLLAAGADVNQAAEDGTTSLWWASAGGHSEIVSQLLAAGGEVNPANTDGQAPLWKASRNGYSEIVSQLLAAGADVNQAAKNGSTSLFWASTGGHSEVVAQLLVAGADHTLAPVSGKYSGKTPLEIARKEGNEACVELLQRHTEDRARVQGRMLTGIVEFTIAAGGLGFGVSKGTDPEFGLQFVYFTGNSDAESLSGGGMRPGKVLARVNEIDLRSRPYADARAALKLRPCKMTWADAERAGVGTVGGGGVAVAGTAVAAAGGAGGAGVEVAAVAAVAAVAVESAAGGVDVVQQICESCSGTGTCSSCGGTGYYELSSIQISFNDHPNSCTACGGDGKTLGSADDIVGSGKCFACIGSGKRR
jgi:hypothetical protein